jgi:hypothetical protein
VLVGHSGACPLLAAAGAMIAQVRGILQRGPDPGDGANLKRLTGVPRLIWFLIWLAATLGAVAVGGKMLIMPT